MMTAVNTKNPIMSFLIKSVHVLALTSMILSGCTADQNESESEETSQLNQDQGIQCEVTASDCPNLFDQDLGPRERDLPAMARGQRA